MSKKDWTSFRIGILEGHALILPGKREVSWKVHFRHRLFSLCFLRSLLKQETVQLRFRLACAGVVVGLAISARNGLGLGLGLRFEVFNAGVVVVLGVAISAWWWLGVAISAWWWLGVAISAWWGLGLADLGVVEPPILPILRISAWVCRSRPRLAFSLPPLFRREGLVVYGGLVAVWRFGL
uniref:Uncharacterized protein n=1 Tax=Fagus sylvatica TaxID=28930 RepID=A0A2N9GF43_FAGSY